MKKSLRPAIRAAIKQDLADLVDPVGLQRAAMELMLVNLDNDDCISATARTCRGAVHLRDTLQSMEI